MIGKALKIALLLMLILILGCKSRHKDGDSTPKVNVSFKDSITIDSSYDGILETEKKVKKNKNYRGSREYCHEMETYNRHIAEKTKGMSHVSQLLYVYEIAVNKYIEAKRCCAIKYNIKDDNNEQVRQMQHMGFNVTIQYQELKKYKMTPEEKKRFEILTKQVIN